MYELNGLSAFRLASNVDSRETVYLSATRSGSPSLPLAHKHTDAVESFGL